MLDFNWGFFWALLAAFAIRGAVRGMLNYMERERKRMIERHG